MAIARQPTQLAAIDVELSARVALAATAKEQTRRQDGRYTQTLDHEVKSSISGVVRETRAVDEYDGPLGKGIRHRVEIELTDGKVYRRAVNDGPEPWFGHDWVEVLPEEQESLEARK